MGPTAQTIGQRANRHASGFVPTLDRRHDVVGPVYTASAVPVSAPAVCWHAG